MLRQVTYGPAFQGQRHWPGTYVLFIKDEYGPLYWTGRFDQVFRGPIGTRLVSEARRFVGARHAYQFVADIRQLRFWRARRVEVRA